MGRILIFAIALLLVQQGTANKIEHEPAACEPTPEPIICPLHEVFNECGSACPRTCDNYQDPPAGCIASCVGGCECEEGYVRNTVDGSCCLESECPVTCEPTPEPIICPLHEVYNECGYACPLTCDNYQSPPELCTTSCVAGCECEEGYVRNTVDGNCCLESECPVTCEPTPEPTICPLHEVFNECGSACPLTCDNYKNAPLICTRQCVVGCECEEGYVRNTVDGSCCLESECPVTCEPTPEPTICPLHEVFNECGSACPLTCDNYKSPPEFCTDNCVVGCECEEGYVRNTADGVCCLESECPVTCEPTPEPTICPLHEVFNECGSACPRTCDNYQGPPELCTMECVVGCECEERYVRNTVDGSCCLESECPVTCEPTPEPTICPLHEVYNECGSACPRTCDNYQSPPEFCTMQCVVGCECEPGYVRNTADGVCCLESECPVTCEPTPEPTICPLHEVFNECGSACPRTCDNYQSPPEFCTMQCVVGCECEPGYVRNTADGVCCLESECPVTCEPTPEPTICPLHEVFNECGSACPRTCDNYQGPPELCIASCVAGCECEEGYVRNTVDGSCCLESECPVTCEPTPEPTICPLHEVYNECGSACPRTCDNYQSPPEFCTMQCVVGCECEPGYVRNTADGVCCLESECPVTCEPTPEPTICPLHEVYNECGSACPRTCDNYQGPPELCTMECVVGCECEEGYVRNTVDGSCCLESECPVTCEPTPEPTICPLHEVYNECGSACPRTCDNYQSPPEFCTMQCVVGCECEPGYVRNTADGVCCLESECPVTCEPTPEPTICPLHEVYNECGSACPRTCDNYQSPPEFCTMQCVVGCECEPGYVRNTADGVCCLESECPVTCEPTPEPTICPLHEVFNECGSACPRTCDNYQGPPELCTMECVVGCECEEGYVRNTVDGSCCLESECPVTCEPTPEPTICPLHEVYNECGSACPRTCDNYQSPPEFCTMQCVVGCECEPGYVRNTADGSCCLESECPVTCEPTPEPTICPLHEVYNECGSACPRTCDNYQSPPEFCTMQCVVGCECEPGYVRNTADGVCCLESECPVTCEPTPEPTICPLHEVFNECGSACPRTCDNYQGPPELCTMECVVGCECEPGYVRNTADGFCCLESECPVTCEPTPEPTICPLHEVFNECGSACPRTCDNYQGPPELCTMECVVGCECEEGYVRNTVDGSCCLESECPVTCEPTPEPTICPLHEVYNECGSACPRTCDNYQSPPEFCTMQCVVGCECEPGYVRNTADGVCCLESECPVTCEPTPEPTICPLHEVFVECGSACAPTCDNYQNPPEFCTLQCIIGCQCEPGYVRNTVDGQCCLPLECPVTCEPTPEPTICPLHEVFNECGSACPRTCDNYQGPPELCIASCVAGCECEEGYVRNTVDGSCCLESECPVTCEPTPEPTICPLHEVFNECGSACPRTCDNYQSPPEFCTMQCVVGCECETGYVRNTADGVCCLESECPVTCEPTPEPTICPLHEVFNECGSACPRTCDNYQGPPELCIASCVAGCECEEGYVRNTVDGSCCLESECPVTCEPTPEPTICPLHEVYNECGSACPRTCDNYQSPPEFCTMQCVVGCECEPGYVRNTADGVCCLESECPVTCEPTPEPTICPLHEVFNECGSACPLTCDNYKNPPLFCTKQCVVGCQCEPGYVRNAADGVCCLESECPVTCEPTPEPTICPLHEVFNECGSACPLTCDNYKNPPLFCTKQCVVGCQCEPGYVRNTVDGSCCLKSECPVTCKPTSKPKVCPLHEVYNECGSACPQTCDNYKNPLRLCTMQCVEGCQCEPGYVRNTVNGKCCLKSECPALQPVCPCPLNQEYKACGSACPLTCENYKNPPRFCSKNCVAGCQCKPGYVKKADGSCCLPSQCTKFNRYTLIRKLFANIKILN